MNVAARRVVRLRVTDHQAEVVLESKPILILPRLEFGIHSAQVHSILDNLEVAKRLSKLTSTTSSQEIFIEALEAVKQWKARTRLSHVDEGEIKVRWVPGHAGIQGNKLADAEAKKGAAMPLPR